MAEDQLGVCKNSHPADVMSGISSFYCQLCKVHACMGVHIYSNAEVVSL